MPPDLDPLSGDGTPGKAGTAAASGVRFRVLAFLACMTFVLYLDRVCIGQAAGAIQDDLGLSNTAMGFVFGAFTLAYGLFEVPTGRLGDRFGSREVLTRIVLWWSLFTALTGAAVGFWMMLAVRFLFGAGEAGALPNTARVLGRWFPESSRGKAQGVVTTAMMVGGAAAPFAAALLIRYVGWRWSFVLFGGLGVIWAVAFYRWYRDDPAEHPGVNDAERRLINEGRGEDPGLAADVPVPWRRILTSRNVWLMGGLMTCGAAVFYMLISWFPKYLQDARGVSDLLSGVLSSLVLAGGAAGCVIGGVLTDRILRATGDLRKSRCRLGSAAFAAGGAALLLGLQSGSVYVAALCTAVTCMCVQIQIPAWWGTITGISGRHVGVLFGLTNSLGVVGAIASQVFLGSLADRLGALGYTGRAQWDPGMYVYAGVMQTGAALWLWVRPERSAVEPPPEGEERGG
ncbi:MAG TPA: MFS transporter [Gemmataceae bacterium]